MKNKKSLFNLLVVFTVITFLSLSATGTFNNQVTEPDQPGNDMLQASLEYFAAIKNNQETGTIDPADVIRAQQMSTKAGISEINWESAGPDNFSGRTRALLYDNQSGPDYNVIFAGSVSGGLWKSNTGGLLWDPVPGTEKIMNISCMVQDTDGKIYIGTGETFGVHRFAAYPGFMGNGIWVSDQNRENFQVLPQTVPAVNDSTSAWAYVNKLAIHPEDQKRIFAATPTGLRYSNDGGTTWELAKDTANNLLDMSATEVVIGADGITAASVNNLVYISDDGDPSNFINYSTGTPEQRLPFAGISRVGLAIAPGNPDVIYAVTTKGTPNLGQLENVFVTINRGDTWRVVGPGGSAFFDVFGADNVGTYAMSVIVHPENPDVVLIGGKNLWQGTKLQDEGYYEWLNKTGVGNAPWFFNSNHHVYVFKPNDPNTILIGTDRGIYRSTDGLASYTNMNKHYVTEQSYSVAFNSGKRLLTGTQSNAVLFISEKGNTARQAQRIEMINRNGGQVAMSVLNQNALIWTTGVPEVSVAAAVPLFRSDDLAETISLHAFSPFTTTKATFLPAMTYWETNDYPHSRDSVTFYANQDFPADTTVWVRSSSSRYPFEYTLPHALSDGDSIRVLDPVATRLFYSATRLNLNEVYMTKGAMNFTKGTEWYKLLEAHGVVQCLTISKDANYLWVGTRTGRLYRLGNLHNAYDSLTANVTSSGFAVEVYENAAFADRAVTSVAVDPQNNDHVIVTLGNYGNDTYVYRSTNATAADPTFTSVQGDLPLMPVYASLIEMNNPEIVVLGTERGIWSTTNIDTTDPVWLPSNGDLGEVAVFQIVQQTNNFPSITVPVDATNEETFPGIDNFGAIYAATFGRGIYKTYDFLIVGIDELPIAGKGNQQRLSIYPNPANEILFVDYDHQMPAQVVISIADISGRIVQQKNFGRLSSGKQTLQIDISSLKNGVYLVQMNNGAETLSNKLVVK
ncbi:MAG TPA: T9SS type A sorting domain-containing protein [Bacteroidales bacterium]|nr:T9SS type A sorting domain-containing protein [Bacteroidales bacterium]